MQTARQPSLLSQLARLAWALLCLSAVASLASAEQIINQSFAGSTTPVGWVVQGMSGSTAMTATDFYGVHGGRNSLRLTSEVANQRASAYYTATTFNARSFTLTASIYVAGTSPNNHGDGLTFSFLDATPGGPLYHNGGLNNALLLGAGGDFNGSPRGELGALTYSTVTGLHGFNFEFDDHRNTGEGSGEYTELVNVSDWSHLEYTEHDYATDSHFYYDSGWEQVQLRAYDGQMYFYWNYANGVYANSYQFAQPASFNYTNTLFGVTGATGALAANHWVDDVSLENSGAGVPEPGSLVLYGLIGLGLPWLRRRKVRAASEA
ncbi:MAG: hypothetical protein WCP21_03700 [Armatimonadota bacterium]